MLFVKQTRAASEARHNFALDVRLSCLLRGARADSSVRLYRAQSDENHSAVDLRYISDWRSAAHFIPPERESITAARRFS